MFMPNFVKIQRIDINLLIFFKKLEKLLLFQFLKKCQDSTRDKNKYCPIFSYFGCPESH